MSNPAAMSVYFKNTFIDVAMEEEAQLPRRRESSAPPDVGRGDREEALANEQLARLGAILRGASEPEAKSPAHSEVSTAPSPTAEAAVWISFSSEVCHAECLVASPEASPVASPVAQLGPALGHSSYPSLGSAGHAARTCRPCAFARSTAGCKFGAECNFCHLVAEHPETVRMRPCKGKRERFKRTMAAIEGKIAQNPELLSNGGLSLPAFVDRNPQARARVMAQLAQVAAGAYHGE